MLLVLVEILLMCGISLADSNEIVLSSVAFHPFLSPVVSQNLALSLGNGINYIPMLGYVRTQNEEDFYSSYKVFVGQNSVGRPMLGGLLGFGGEWRNFQAGLIVGMYYQEMKYLSDAGIHTYCGDLTPIIGSELNYKFHINSKEFIKLTNTFTMFIISTAISYGWYY